MAVEVRVSDGAQRELDEIRDYIAQDSVAAAFTLAGPIPMTIAPDTPFLLPKTRRELQPLLESAGIRMRKEWGQCLLLDINMLNAIVRDAGVQQGDLVLEIGPGPGTLTEMLLRAGAWVVAVDIDRGLATLSANALGTTGRLTMLRADAMGRHNELNPGVLSALRGVLAGDLGPAQAHEEVLCTPESLPGPFTSLRVVANLPYQISAPVLIALLEAELPIASMTLLLQLEVAEKLEANPGDDDWGLLSLIRHLRADAKLVRKVPKHCFWPQPKVESGLIQLTPYAEQPDAATYGAIKSVAASLFQYRRKTLNQAAQHGLGLTSDQTKAWLSGADVNPSDRVEVLTMEELGALARTLPARSE